MKNLFNEVSTNPLEIKQAEKPKRGTYDWEDEAHRMERLVQDEGYTYDEIAAEYGVTRQWIAICLKRFAEKPYHSMDKDKIRLLRATRNNKLARTADYWDTLYLKAVLKRQGNGYPTITEIARASGIRVSTADWIMSYLNVDFSIRMTDQERLRFYTKRKPNDGCWEYQSSILPNGYGRISVKGRLVYAHRYSWEVANGPIPCNKWVLHKCDNPRCVRADHLFLGDAKDNAQDREKKGRSNRKCGKGTDTPVVAVKEGKAYQYPSVTACARALGVGQSSVSNHMRGRFKTVKGYVVSRLIKEAA